MAFSQAFDLVVIGSGPAGLHAATHAARGGLRVALCEQRREVGGACVHHGTIPSKALRERAVRRVLGGGLSAVEASVSVADLIGEVGDVVAAHDRYMSRQLERSGVTVIHGRARFRDPHTLEVRSPGGGTGSLTAARVVVATGSVPRRLPHIAVDHEHVYDSDSVLSLAYLPRSLVVLGGGVVACEYASVFALLGVRVTLVDRSAAPLGFLEPALVDRFVERFVAMGGEFVGGASVTGTRFDGVSGVVTELADGRALCSDKVLCALGRVAQVAGLDLEHAGVTLNDRGLVAVNEHGQTAVPHVYAAGDVVGPPALASASMEQGRRAACHMLGTDPGSGSRFLPTGIYAVPELASVGMTEAEARLAGDGVVTGMASFEEVARAHIADAQDGFLKLIVGGDGRLLGVHACGAQATELVHMGQMALIHGADVSVFIDNVFNFPTYGEAFRIAALDAVGRIAQGAAVSAG
ncbi:MAG: Si-specific NAD(P)(+) transhydrogenase [Gammaproteobacteria bacterium]|nr:Si-specific NAD(P)(+) transhydrogenase [Gammaproteobacteria bacterium]